MTQQDKELLLKDLCARLPYGVKTYLETSEYGELIGTLDAIYPTEERVIVDNLDKAIAPINVRYGRFRIEEDKVKPYLRPMSSMTEEEKKELQLAFNIKASVIGGYGISSNEAWWVKDRKEPIGFDTIPYKSFYGVVDWLNSHHFDYRGLIEKGLALKAPEGMYTDDKFVPITKEELEKIRISSKDYLI